MPPLTYRQHETSLCVGASKWPDKIFETHPELPFGTPEIDRFGGACTERSSAAHRQGSNQAGPITLREASTAIGAAAQKLESSGRKMAFAGGQDQR
jgi:hypothetical protein